MISTTLQEYLSPAARHQLRLDAEATDRTRGEFHARLAHVLLEAGAPLSRPWRGFTPEMMNNLGWRGITGDVLRAANISPGESEFLPSPALDGSFVYIPYIDDDGAPFGFTLRAVDGRKLHIQPRGFNPRIPYGGHIASGEAARLGRTLFVVEGEIDAASVIVCGHEAVGFRGASSVAKMPAAYFQRWRHVSRAVALCDGDDAGRGTFLKAIVSRCVTVLGLPWVEERLGAEYLDGGTDPNDYLQAGRLRPLLERLEAA